MKDPAWYIFNVLLFLPPPHVSSTSYCEFIEKLRDVYVHKRNVLLCTASVRISIFFVFKYTTIQHLAFIQIGCAYSYFTSQEYINTLESPRAQIKRHGVQQLAGGL